MVERAVGKAVLGWGTTLPYLTLPRVLLEVGEGGGGGDGFSGSLCFCLEMSGVRCGSVPMVDPAFVGCCLRFTSSLERSVCRGGRCE